MANRQVTELRKMSRAELNKRLQALRRELFDLRFQKMTGKLENYTRMKQVRRNIARVLTILNEMSREGKS